MKALKAYRSAAVTTADPMAILVALYDGLIKHLTSAEMHLDAGNKGAAGERISKSLAILSELQASIDRRADENFSEQLSALYSWFSQEVIQANLRGEAERIGLIMPMVRDLRDAWAEAATKVRVSGELQQKAV